MNILIDTNVILDVLCNRADFVEDSLKVFRLCEAEQITGYISALSIPNIVYIMRKELDNARIKEILTTLTAIFQAAIGRRVRVVLPVGAENTNSRPHRSEGREFFTSFRLNCIL